jgi:integrase
MAAIEQRPSGKWQARVRRDGFPAQSKSFALKSDAEAWARSIEREMDRGSYIASAAAERMTFDKLALRFLTEYAPHHYRSPAHLHKVDHLRARLGDFSLAQLTPDVITEYRDDRLEDPDPRFKDVKRAPKISAATVKSELDVLSKMLDVAQKEFGITLPNGNPVRNIRKPAAGPARARRLTQDEWERLDAAAARSLNPWLRPALHLAVETAMRQGELLALKRADIDEAKRTAWLQLTKNGEARAVPLTSRALEVIKGLPTTINGVLLPLEKPTLHSSFATACRRAEVKDFRWHDLRHEALSRFAERGDLSLLELAAISGHKGAGALKMLQVYVQFNASKLAQKLG